MNPCSRCGSRLDEGARFCSGCGLRNGFFQKLQPLGTATPGHSGEAKGFLQMYGLDPRVAFLAFVLDLMLFGSEVLTFGATVVVAAVVGVIFGYIAYRAQMKWYGDDHDSAMIKGLILGLLTAIPTPLPAILFVSSGVMGLAHNLLGKKQPKFFAAGH